MGSRVPYGSKKQIHSKTERVWVFCISSRCHYTAMKDSAKLRSVAAVAGRKNNGAASVRSDGGRDREGSRGG